MFIYDNVLNWKSFAIRWTQTQIPLFTSYVTLGMLGNLEFQFFIGKSDTILPSSPEDSCKD